jgi:LytS/YehU family sensor histidine kinase
LNHLARILGWRRLAVMLVAAVPAALLVSINSRTELDVWLLRAVIVGLCALLAYGIAEHWPRRLPRWVGRWFYELAAIAVAIPLGVYLSYWITIGGNPAFMSNPGRVIGFSSLTAAGLFFGLWLALGAMVRQRDALTHQQVLAFERERGALEKQATDARLQLLRAQVQPHFLFNTLANVQALVESGSPQAPRLLGSLIAYLKAAVPQLEQTSTPVAREIELVRAYLELMRMRMPDRLQFTIHVEPEVQQALCPPTALLTLVENAVRHGIDPSEDGGTIEVTARRDGESVVLRVADSGIGLGESAGGLGTGLQTLRERLRLAYGDRATLHIRGREPHGVVAEIRIPAAGAPA